MKSIDIILPLVLRFNTAKDIEAMTIASKYFATQILPYSSLWKQCFCRQWKSKNFNLEGVEDGNASITISSTLRDKFPMSWTESRIFQVLTHAIKSCPSHLNINAPYAYCDEIQSFPPYNNGYTGKALNVQCDVGYQKFVCGSKSLPSEFQIRVLKTSPNEYIIAASKSSYFEISICKSSDSALQQRACRHNSLSIGLARANIYSFTLDEPFNWRHNSYTFDSDGKYSSIHEDVGGVEFGPSYGLGDTIGCCVCCMPNCSSLCFTKNGDMIDSGSIDMTCDSHNAYPVVGLYSPNIVCINFGQQPFQYPILRKFNEECEEEFQVEMLSWLDLDTNLMDGESTEDDQMYDFNAYNSMGTINRFYNWSYGYYLGSYSDYDYDSDYDIYADTTFY